MKRSIWLVMMISLTTFPLAACSGATSSSGGTLEGTVWSLVTLGQNSLIPGTTITLSFENGQVGGTSGCNSYGGSYQVSGESLSLGDLFMTEMACLEPEGVMQQEGVYLGALGSAQTYTLSGGSLTIILSDGGALVFELAQ